MNSSVSVLLMLAESFKANRNATMEFASSVALDRKVTAIPFCPIENSNIITLTVRINSIAEPSGKHISMAVVKTLSKLSGARLSLVLGKEAALMSQHSKSDVDGPFHWFAALGDSSAGTKMHVASPKH